MKQVRKHTVTNFYGVPWRMKLFVLVSFGSDLNFAAKFLRENVFFAGTKRWFFCYTGTHISDEGSQQNDYIYFEQNCLQH